MSRRDSNPNNVSSQARASNRDATPSEGGLSTRAAADAISDILDDEGHAPGHVDPSKGRRSNRELVEGSEDHEEYEEYEDDEDELDDSEPQKRKQDQDEDDEDEGEYADSSDDEADTEDAINSITDIADELDIDVNELLSSLSHTFKASGEEHTVTLAEIIAGYQKDADYRKRTTELAETRRAFDAQVRERDQEFHRQAAVHAQQLNYLQQMVTSELQSPELATLRTTNPAEWAAQVREIEGRGAQLNAAREQAGQQYNEYFTRQRQEFVAREAQILKDKVEDWGEPKLREAVDVIRTLGFNDQELMDVVDHRLIMTALELGQLRKDKKTFEARLTKAGKTAKRVKEDVPNSPKPGTRKTKGRKSIERGKLANAKKKLKRSADKGGRENIQAAAELIEQLI